MAEDEKNKTKTVRDLCVSELPRRGPNNPGAIRTPGRKFRLGYE